MSHFTRSCFALIIASVVALLVFLLVRNDKVSSEATSERGTVASNALPGDPGEKDASESSGELARAAAGASKLPQDKEGHAADCAHCSAKSNIAAPQMTTNPNVDYIFKAITPEVKMQIPRSTFDFLRGSQVGDEVGFQIGELEFQGTVGLSREDHQVAKSYGIYLDDDLGRVRVVSDAGGNLTAQLFFFGDSRVVQARSARVEGEEGEVLAVAATTVDSVICATPDTIATQSGYRSVSGQGALKAPSTSAENLKDPASEESLEEVTKALAVPLLQSEPDSEYVMFLDFDGAVITGTEWNFDTGVDPINALPLAQATDDEWVNLVWRRVVEDYAPFNINVTTDESVFNAQVDPTKRLHVVITSTDTAAPTFGGVAYLHSFRTVENVCWVFNDSEYTAATTISHESGHAFGLRHDGLDPFFEYYFGHDVSYAPGWAPIMGAGFGDGFNDEVDQWSIGDYTNSTNTEDDLTIIGDTTDPQDGPDTDIVFFYTETSNGFGFKEDEEEGILTDSGNNTLQGSGLISTNEDIDLFEFRNEGGILNFTISPLDVNSIYSEPGSGTSGANLAVDARLLDSTGQEVAVGDDTGSNLLSSFIQRDVPVGTYFLEVRGGGRGDGPDTGFSDYGSLGEYTIVGELSLPPLSVFGGSKQTASIFNGTTSTDASRGTDFGFTTIGSSVGNTFFLKNSGEVTEINDLEITLASGANSQFELSNPTSFDNIDPGAGQFFDITYAPSATGTHTETVVITYDVGGPQVYEFTIKGSAVNTSGTDNYEPNNNSGAAYDLSGNESNWLEDINGLAFFLSDQNDWYTFTVDATDDLLRVEFSPEVDTENVTFELLNFNLDVLESATDGQFQFLIPENYTGSQRKFYIRVSSTADSSVRNAYDLRWAAIELGTGIDDLYENDFTRSNNNTRDNAFDLTDKGTRLSEILGPAVSNDEDWYKIEIGQDPFIRMLYVAALFKHAEGDIELEVYRESVLRDFSSTNNDRELVNIYDTINFDSFADPFTYTPSGNFIVMGVQPGTYYIRVFGDFAGNEYDLIVDPRRDDRYEVVDESSGTENDLLANAYPLGEEIVGKWLSEIDGVGTPANYPQTATETNFINSGDNDWFSFSIGGTDTIGQISLEFENLNGGGTLEFYLYSSTGGLLASNQDDSGILDVLTVASPPGRDFYVRVVGTNENSSALSGYDFRINFSSEPIFNEDPVEDNYEQNDNFQQLFNISNNEGRYLSSIAGYGTQLDPDWYQISIPGNAARLDATLIFVNEDGDLDLTLTRGATTFVSSNGTSRETITWENPVSGLAALTVTGPNNGNFYNLIWDITYSEDNYEENDALSQAFPLTDFENRSILKKNGIAIQADEDWYRISASADTAELRAAITFTHVEGDIDLALYNAAGGVVQRSTSTTDNESLTYENPLPGDYFLRAYFGDQANEYNLTWSALTQAELDLIPAGDDNYEENDKLDQIHVLGDTERRLSRAQGLGIQKDEDWYQIEVPAGNVGLIVEALFTDSLGDIDIEIYDPLGFPLAVRDSIDDNEVLVLNSPVPQGTYAIRVYGPNLGNEYDLYWNPFIEDIYEENDDYTEAEDISLRLGTPLSDVSLATQGDDDWYSFNISGSLPFISVELSYTELDGSIDFELLDSGRNVIATADSLDDFDSILEPAVSGLYYVRVFGENHYNTYDLKVSIIDDDEYEENDTSGQAFDITEIPSLQAVQFDDDWYKFSVTDTNNFLTASARFLHSSGNIDIALFSETDLSTPIASSTSSIDAESVRVPGVAGTYYIHVTGDNTNQAYDLTWTVAPDDQFEDNDSRVQATNISSAEGLETNAIQFDEDWFEISVGPGKLKLVVDLFFSHADDNLNLTLYNSSGEELVVEDTGDDDEQISFSLFPFGTEPETYFVKVDGASVGANYTLVWTSSTEDNFEGDTGNNTYTTAAGDLLESEGLRISSTIGYGGALNDDWYKVQINPGDEGLVVEVLFEHSDTTNIDLELFSAEQSLIRRSMGESNVERIHHKGAPGTYYLRVFGSSGGNAYDLVWNSYTEDDREISGNTPNDTPNQANSRVAEFVPYNNLTLLDEDWHIFFAEEGDNFTLNVEFDHDRGDIDIAVFRFDGTLVAQSESVDDEESIVLFDLPEGLYYICIYGYGIYSPKSEDGWSPGTFDPFAEDFDPLTENTDPTLNSIYDLAEGNARALGNSYSIIWVSTQDDRFDIETPVEGDDEVNDSRLLAAVPELINQNGILDDDGLIDRDVLFRTGTDPDGNEVEIPEQSYYEYEGLSQLDEDWYRFEVAGGGSHEFFVSLDFSAFQADIDLYVYNETGDLIAVSDSSSSDEFVDITGSGQTVYFVQVVGEDFGTPYKLEVRGFGDDLYEENDTLEDADANANITAFRGLNASPGPLISRDIDYFRVDVPDDQVNLSVRFSSDHSGFDVDILDSSGNVLPTGYNQTGIATDGETTFGQFFSSYGVISPVGDHYYIRVNGPENGARYELQWDYDNNDEYDLVAESDTSVEEGDNNDIFENANELTKLRLEPGWDKLRDPVQKLAFDYSLFIGGDGFMGPTSLDLFGKRSPEPFGHAIQESDDWYKIQVPSWILATASKNNQSIEVIKRIYNTRLTVKVKLVNGPDTIKLDVYDLPDTEVVPRLLGRATTTTEDTLTVQVPIDPIDEDRVYYFKVYGNDSAAKAYELEWEITDDDAYDQLGDDIPENDLNNFVERAFDLTNADGESTEGTALHEIGYLQDVNGDGVIDALDGGVRTALGYGKQITDDWFAVVVSEGATQLSVELKSYSDNDTGYDYKPDDLDMDFEVYFLADDDGDPATYDLRKPVLIGRSISDTDESVFESEGKKAKSENPDLVQLEDITREVIEADIFDVSASGPGIYFIRIYFDGRAHPYTFTWDDIGDTDNSSDAAFIDSYLNGNWSFTLLDELPTAALTAPDSNPDGDRFTNSIEYALGLDTEVADNAILGQRITEFDGKQHFQFDYVRNRDAKGFGYSFIVQESDDLTFSNDKQAVYVRTESVPDDLSVERVVYRSFKSIDEQDKSFFRLVIIEPPTTGNK